MLNIVNKKTQYLFAKYLLVINFLHTFVGIKLSCPIFIVIYSNLPEKCELDKIMYEFLIKIYYELNQIS